MSRGMYWLSAVLTITIFASAAWAFDYDESIDGDLSGLAASPTSLSLDLGANSLLGSAGGGDFDFLTFEVGASQQWDQLLLDVYTGPSLSFVGLQSGSVWTAGQGGGIDPSLLLGWTHFGAGDLGADILGNISGGGGAIGFTPPLGPGHYSLLIQDTGAAVGYGLTAMISATIDGDFDNNGLYECLDVDALVSHIVDVAGGATPDPSFDLNQDTMIDPADLDAWLAEAGSVLTTSGNPILPGDASLNGTVDGQDFVAWNANKFTSTASWCSGDFNADGSINGQDFIAWNINKFQTSDSTVVAEPAIATSAWLLVALIGCLSRRRV